ncbi:hypothetical protein PY093_11350 [Cytobacillus sp. S13-E01]|uniref:hypothetical protein n=1 Tax=Cytobacillus sp. S13-E01 TaxID=3031326 RepID=UPI0023D893E5|nr:hypothetical protein [Cytobacillus sp. S13-E01]MDF0727294.1 hypothetical protein [Cytobacillus sp. S13-E01]
MTQTKLWTKDFITISFSTFFVFLTFYYLLVILPIYALQEFNATESEAGLFGLIIYYFLHGKSRVVTKEHIESSTNV